MLDKCRRSLVVALGAFILGLAVLMLPSVIALIPSGANVSFVNSSYAPVEIPNSWEAIAGNVTELTLYGNTVTQTWQGYYGNVSGVIQLGDGSDNIMYNWTLANPRGEVYATRNSTINWKNVTCFNFTADETFVHEGPAGTSLHGLNLTGLEDMYGINATDVDGVEETFNAPGHRTFYTANLKFNAGECRTAATFNSTGMRITNFQEVLMYEPITTSVIYNALLENSARGFDNADHDFQMLVLENGHLTDVTSTTYYFFVELE